MGLDCSFNNKSLDRWYVFKDHFDMQRKYTKSETLHRLGELLIDLSETDDEVIIERMAYHIDWISRALKLVREKDNIFLDYINHEYKDYFNE
jgi:hypothetical protein